MYYTLIFTLKKQILVDAFTIQLPKHIKEKGPYGQFLRLRRNCAKEADFKLHSVNMAKDCSKRGYPNKCISPQQTRATKTERKGHSYPQNASFQIWLSFIDPHIQSNESPSYGNRTKTLGNCQNEWKMIAAFKGKHHTSA
jgi:hypothetical protein